MTGAIRIATAMSILLAGGQSETNTTLLLLWNEATAAATVAESLAAYDRFAEEVAALDRAGVPYAAEIDRLRFDVPFQQARRLREAGAQEQEVLIGVEHYLRQYLRQFQARSDLPGGVTTDDEAAGWYALGETLWQQGELLEQDGRNDRALAAWTEARDVLHRGVQLVLEARDDAAPDGDGSRYLGMLADLYLRQVASVEEPERYVTAVESAFAWLPRDDHAVIGQLRRQGLVWADDQRTLESAATLLDLVRRAHADWWDGAYETLADNLLAHVGGVHIALRLGQLPEAAVLLEALGGLVGRIDDPAVQELYERSERQLRQRYEQQVLLEEMLGAADQAGHPVDEPAPAVAPEVMGPPVEAARLRPMDERREPDCSNLPLTSRRTVPAEPTRRPQSRPAARDASTANPGRWWPALVIVAVAGMMAAQRRRRLSRLGRAAERARAEAVSGAVPRGASRDGRRGGRPYGF
jgi:hypothetical protein